jgi:feruloyl esterase
MAPGMAHCAGGEGPNSFDKMSPLEQWIERGTAPDHIVAMHLKDGKVDRSRPLCPYPQIAQHKGSGSIDDATSFACN